MGGSEQEGTYPTPSKRSEERDKYNRLHVGCVFRVKVMLAFLARVATVYIYIMGGWSIYHSERQATSPGTRFISKYRRWLGSHCLSLNPRQGSESAHCCLVKGTKINVAKRSAASDNCHGTSAACQRDRKASDGVLPNGQDHPVQS
ncbi:hypothetical protein EJ03DRAFT_97820 [Teratosphaeria nubilosa]|uniref:Uncharacterized protein n=1 Tax=Teratosphaeria nubilosa TaxID=161662 RepID=A0A6G1L9F9_9PEZI|nr:hypothetical protein EJ03DRAFT_97820 [Teratosphaeria nubilosa]